MLYQCFCMARETWMLLQTARRAATWGISHGLPTTNPWYTMVPLRYQHHSIGPDQRRQHHFSHPKTAHDNVRPHPSASGTSSSPCCHASGCKPDIRQQWRRARGSARNTWIRQVEVDSGLSADAAWDCWWSLSVKGATTPAGYAYMMMMMMMMMMGHQTLPRRCSHIVFL